MTIVATVRSITRHDSYTTYTIEDGSGVIDTVEWIKNSAAGGATMFDENNIG